MNFKKYYKYIFILGLITISLFFVYNFVNKGIEDTTKIEAEETFTTNELLLKLQTKEQKLESFIEKAIEIEGEIKEITFQDGKYSLILKGDSDKTYILCEMQSNQSDDVLKLHAGEDIKLKGILKGFLMDIILLHCVII
ncbi:OB-fold protein [Kordia sp.]|uniref:OB-fold protein n=1 Tax=Kordia sp. TaxID=1965332 RepID=UPI003B5C7707